MTLRISTSASFAQVLQGIRANQFRVFRAQEQVASGRRILRPSDDPTGAVRALSLGRRIADVGRFSDAIGAARSFVEAASGELQAAQGLIAEARSLLLQGMNGTLSQEDREALVTEFELLRTQLLEVGNRKSGGRSLFAGTETAGPAWRRQSAGGRERIVYAGNGELQRIRVGDASDVAINIPGQELFGKMERSGVVFDGLTGVAKGRTANEGTGYEYLTLRHDSTDPGNLLSVGIALAKGGAEDSFLSAQILVIDPASGTARLGAGPAVPLPAPGAGANTDFVVENEKGGALHLDLSGYTGAAYTGTVTGNGSISIDGTSFVPLTFAEKDLELENSGTGSILHVDTTAVLRTGEELVQYGGAVNVFDVLQGVAEDLANAQGLDTAQLQERLGLRLDELDRNEANVLIGIGMLGARDQRLTSSDQRLQTLDVQLRSLRSGVEDADLAEVALDLTRADQSLQAAQASGVRLIQTSLLNFL